jgi:hypothetical protein
LGQIGLNGTAGWPVANRRQVFGVVQAIVLNPRIQCALQGPYWLSMSVTQAGRPPSTIRHSPKWGSKAKTWLSALPAVPRPIPIDAPACRVRQ